jgi:hypothetical protein
MTIAVAIKATATSIHSMSSVQDMNSGNERKEKQVRDSML